MANEQVSFRPQGGGAVYAPSRDWAHNYPEMLKCVARAFNRERWPEVCDVVATAMAGTGKDWWAELCAANEAYARFASSCALDCEQSMTEVLRESGWLALHPAAQAGFLAMLGQVFTGQLFRGLRDITELGDVPTSMADVQRLLEAGLDARRILNGMTKGDDLKVDLATLLRLLRNEQVPWQVIDTIVNREKALEGVDTNS